MIADCHTHCAASEDSETPIEALCAAAVNKGIDFLAVTDHVETIEFREKGYNIAAEQAWAMMSCVQTPLHLLRGIELGVPQYDTALSARLLAAHPYDFVLGSQHRLSDAQPDYYYIDYSAYSDSMIEREMQAFFEATLSLVRWNGFDSLAHLTYPFRYLPEKWRNGDYRCWQGILDELLGTLAENGKSLEINTSGLRKGQGVTSPDLPLIRRFYELGGRHITIGSDAHRSHEVGANLAQAAALALQAGFDSVTVYEQRRPKTLPIDLKEWENHSILKTALNGEAEN